MYRKFDSRWIGVFTVLTALTLATPAFAQIVFNDISAGDQNGIDYRRQPSPRLAVKSAIEAMSPIPNSQFLPFVRPMSPQKPAGSPGVALFDYDDDGDIDIYVTNGPGTANSLFQNQLIESGNLTFVDVATAAGVAATAQDSSGVCFGDTDNDGDSDLYVVATGMANIFFANNGDGTFSEVAGSGAEGSGRHAVGCSMADFNGDGLLDVTVGNSYDDWEQRIAVFGVAGDNSTYPGMEHNYLFLNQGGNSFADASAANGLENVSNMSGPGLTGAAFTWALGSADIDLDGDVDILNNDNQGPPSAGDPSLERGWNRIYENDGTGNFTDVTVAKGLDIEGGWMGTAFGDWNCDGLVDFFATDLGYLRLGANSRWFLQNADGTFTDPGLGSLIRTPFGWGATAFDYDNDGDYDIYYNGGVDILNFQVGDNPGVMLENTGSCSAVFDWDSGAILREHRIRSVQGVASADLNNDGFSDLVTVANFLIQPRNFAPAVPFSTVPTGSPFDAVARMEFAWVFGVNPGFATWLGGPTRLNNPPLPGDLSVEINSADNGNNWVSFEAAGGAGILSSGGNNRDGIGAVIFFTPDGGNTSLKPVDGGASYGSQDSLVKGFGLGSATSGTVEILWPGGVRNRVYDVQAGESLVLPEIPCSYDAAWKNFGQYNSCVMQALNAHKAAGNIDAATQNRLRDNARRAFDEAQ